LILEEIEVQLDTVSLPHSEREEVVVIPLSLLAGSVLDGEQFNHLHEVAVNGVVTSRTSRGGHTFQTGRKGEAQDRVVVGIANHLVLKMTHVLYRITYPRVLVEYWSGELLWELVLLDLLGEGDSWILAVRAG